jgi:uncharacterized phage protein (TIGR01671 family)
MEREIKFRAKQCVITQHFPIRYGLTDWIYGWLHCYFDGSFFTYISNINDEKMETETYSVESSTVSQFINFKDKNDKEIYEGDIVASEGINFLVKWDKMECSFILYNKLCSFKTNDFNFVDFKFKQVEVIGNVFDNPDLLSE